MPANVETMAYYGDVPWHGLGKSVPATVTADEMIHAAGLDWDVALKPARGAKMINKTQYSRYEITRVPRPRTQESEVLFGVVSRRYQPLQNTEAFAFFDPIVGAGRAQFETAGALGEGERVWVLARMPDAMEVVRGDECYKYLLLSNTHTGEGSVIVKFTPIRVVCQNTLILAMDDGQKAYRVRHSKIMQFKLEELATFLDITQSVFLQAEQQFKRLAAISMKKGRLEQYLNAVYPQTVDQKKKDATPLRWSYVQEVFESRPDLLANGVRGTLWGAYNAITYFEDYKQADQAELSDQRLNRAWFGSGADIKLKALDQALTLANTWHT